MEKKTTLASILLNILIPLLEIALVCFLGPKLLMYFLPFVIGWIIAMIANPLVRFLEKRVKIVRKHSSAIIVVVVLALVISVGYFLISRLVFQTINLVRNLPELFEMLTIELKSVEGQLDSVFRFLPANVQQSWHDLVGNVGQALGLLVQQLASPTVEVAGNVAKRIPSILVGVIVTILSSYFFIAERDKILQFWKRHWPTNGGKYYRQLKGDAKHLIGGYFLAQFKIMFVVALLLLIGFLILGVKYALVLCILIAMLDFLPLFGTGTVLIPWAIYNLFTGEYFLAVGMILLYVLTQVVRQLIQPKIVGDSMGLPPLWTLVFLYLGFKVHGISGMILAVPIGILVLNLYKYGAFDNLIDNVKLLQQELRRIRGLDQDEIEE